MRGALEGLCAVPAGADAAHRPRARSSATPWATCSACTASLSVRVAARWPVARTADAASAASRRRRVEAPAQDGQPHLQRRQLQLAHPDDGAPRPRQARQAARRAGVERPPRRAAGPLLPLHARHVHHDGLLGGHRLPAHGPGGAREERRVRRRVRLDAEHHGQPLRRPAQGRARVPAVERAGPQDARQHPPPEALLLRHHRQAHRGAREGHGRRRREGRQGPARALHPAGPVARGAA